MNKKFDLDIDSPIFENLKNAFNAMLQNTFSAMKERNVNDADINIKLNINVRDFYIAGIDKDVRVPIFEHQITSKMQVKNSVKGHKSGKFDLKFDEENQRYYVEEYNDEQTSMFENEGESDAE